MKRNKRKISIFNFKKDWNLVEPHLSNPHLLKLLNKAMYKFSIDRGPGDLPIWNPNDDIGPWKYGRPCCHKKRAIEKAFEGYEVRTLIEKYMQLCEDEGLDFAATVYSTNHDDPKKGEIAEAYIEESLQIVESYLPQKNTYEWYQCFTAGSYLKKWQLELAKKVFPDFKWRIFEKVYEKFEQCAITHIGRNANREYLIFDIFNFDKGSVDEILVTVGLNRNTLDGEWVVNKIQNYVLRAV